MGGGWRLLQFALSQAGGDGGVRLAATLNARAFYEKHGFVGTGESQLVRASGMRLATVLMARR